MASAPKKGQQTTKNKAFLVIQMRPLITLLWKTVQEKLKLS